MGRRLRFEQTIVCMKAACFLSVSLSPSLTVSVHPARKCLDCLRFNLLPSLCVCVCVCFPFMYSLFHHLLFFLCLSDARSSDSSEGERQVKERERTLKATDPCFSLQRETQGTSAAAAAAVEQLEHANALFGRRESRVASRETCCHCVSLQLLMPHRYSCSTVLLTVYFRSLSLSH